MQPKGARRQEVLERLQRAGGLRPGAVTEVHRQTGVPEADVYGVATFYHLLSHPHGIRVCQGLSCKLHGSDRVLAELQQIEGEGHEPVAVACLGRCDLAPAVWDPGTDPDDPAAVEAPGHVASIGSELAIDLEAPDNDRYAALAHVAAEGAEWFLEQLEAAKLTGRGGAGFPTHTKWRAARQQRESTRYVVLNADEGEPGTFKDREIILRRPHLVVEGLAITAGCIEADDVYLYVRGEFRHVKASLRRAIEAAQHAGRLGPTPRFHFVDGQGAYICGEETALLESIEGKRGLPRLRPPYPVEKGLWGKPTVIQNVETVACLPAIALRGGEWFAGLGRQEGGTKLYCLSGHVARPGVYEAPMGATLRELLDAAGGCTGSLKAFSPGGASSGFLPASEIDRPLDFGSLHAVGSMLGSAGVVVMNDSVDMVEAALVQAVFFEDESCGQCAPCRIGTRMLRQALERYLAHRRGESRDPEALAHVRELAWGMEEGSICGLGQAAPLPLVSAMKYWPEEFGLSDGGGR